MLWVGLILLIALAVRVAGAWAWHDATLAGGQLFRLGDSHSYWILAGHLVRGEPYQYGSPDASVFRAPLYPLLLAPWTLITDPSTGVWCARLLGCGLGTVAVWLVMQLARRGGGDRAACIAGVLAAFYPGAIGMSIVILSEAIFCPLMLLSLLAWHKAIESPRVRPVVLIGLLAGVASGLAILARPSWLLFWPFAGILVLAFHHRRAHQLQVLVLVAIGCGLTMTPWWIRNAMLTARFVPTTLQVGASLYDGLHEGASGGSDENMEFVDRFIAEQRRADAQWAAEHQAAQAAPSAEAARSRLWQRSTFEYRLNARMQAAALEWARKNISGAIRLGLIKFARTWSLWPTAGEFGSTGLRLVLTVGCLGVLIPAAAAVWILRRQATGVVVVCVLPAIYFTLLHMVFVGSIRYREPAMLLLTALAGCGVSRLPVFQRPATTEPQPDSQ